MENPERIWIDWGCTCTKVACLVTGHACKTCGAPPVEYIRADLTVQRPSDEPLRDAVPR